MTTNNNPIPFGVLRGHTESVNSVCFVDENFLVSCAANGELRLWNIKNRRAEVSILAHSHSIQSIVKVPCSNCVITGARDGFSKLWDLSGPLREPHIIFQNGMNHFCNVAVDHSKQDSNIFVTAAAEESQIMIWDMRQCDSPIHIISPKVSCGSTGMLTSLLYHSSSSFTSTDVSPKIFAGFENGSLQCFDLRNLKCINSFQSHKEPIFALDMSPLVSNAILTAGADTAINQLKYSHHKISTAAATTTTNDNINISCNIKKSLSLSAAGIGCICHRGDGRLFVTANWDHSVRIYDAKRMKPLACLRYHRDTVNTVAFSPMNGEREEGEGGLRERRGRRGGATGGVFATGSKDNTIALWDVYSHTVRSSVTAAALTSTASDVSDETIVSNSGSGSAAVEVLA